MIRISASALALALLCGAAQAQTINVALNADIRSTNPGVNRDDNTDAVVLHMVEGLVGYRENGAVVPFLYNQVDTAVVSKRLQGLAPWVASKPRLWEVSVAK